MKHTLKLFTFIAILSVLLAISCKDSKDDNEVLGTNEVSILSDAFMPLILTVPVNTTITWTNKDVRTHTVTSDNDLFDSGNISPDGIFRHQFTATGTYTYHCSIHSAMTGTVIVQ